MRLMSPAQDGVVPDAAAVAERHVADDHRAISDVHALAQGGLLAKKFVEDCVHLSHAGESSETTVISNLGFSSS